MSDPTRSTFPPEPVLQAGTTTSAARSARTASRRRSPCGTGGPYSRRSSEGVVAHLAGADPDHLLHRGDPDLAVADRLGAGGGHDGVGHPLGVGVVGHDL